MNAVVAWLPGAWFTVVLIFCFLIAWVAYNGRAMFSWQAWTLLAVFYLGIVASNGWQLAVKPGTEFPLWWQFIQSPGEPALETFRLWIFYANIAARGAQLEWIWMILLVGFVLWLSKPADPTRLRWFEFHNSAPMLTGMIYCVLVVSQIGEGIEFPLCKLTDPALGMEHEYFFSGGQRTGCTRSLGLGGSLIFPALTVAPLPFWLLAALVKRGARIPGWSWAVFPTVIFGIIAIGIYRV